MLNDISKILQCPYSKKHVRFHDSGKYLAVQDSDRTYPITDGIIHFIPEKGTPFFDSKHAAGGLVQKTARWMEGRRQLAGKHLGLPSNFSQAVLDMPAASHSFNLEKFKTYKGALFIVADSDPAFLVEAKKRYSKENIQNVYFLCCDPGKLPLADKSLAMAVSMFSFHRIAKKQETIQEIARILRISGAFVGAFCIHDQGLSGLYKSNGQFSEPFGTQQQAKDLLFEKFDMAEEALAKNQFFFNCRKSWPSCGNRWS